MNSIKTLLTTAAVVAASLAAFSTPANAAGPGGCSTWRCGYNGTTLNGFRVNGIELQGTTLNGPGLILQGVAANGLTFNGPGIVVQGPASTGFVDGQDSAPIAVRLAGGKIIRLR